VRSALGRQQSPAKFPYLVRFDLDSRQKLGSTLKAGVGQKQSHCSSAV
jgi:hypothetical protein